MTVRIKPRARADLLGIKAWGEDTWGAARSREFLEGLIEAVDRLVDFPEMGRARPAFGQGLRSIRYRGYVLFYVIEEGVPALVAVLHERRNLAGLSFGDQE